MHACEFVDRWEGWGEGRVERGGEMVEWCERPVGLESPLWVRVHCGSRDRVVRADVDEHSADGFSARDYATISCNWYIDNLLQE